MDNPLLVRMFYQNALIKLDQAISEENPIDLRRELADFELSFTNLLKLRSLLSREEMCTYWVIGFDTIAVLSKNILEQKKWSSLFDDAIRACTSFVRNIPINTKSAVKRQISQRFRTLLGFLSLVLTDGDGNSPSMSISLKCLDEVIDVIFSTPFLLRDFYAKSSISCLGYLVSALLGVYESKTKDNEMRIHAGKQLLKIVCCKGEDAALTLLVVLPGTSSRLIKSTFSELHSEIICLAFRIFTGMVVTTMNDNVFIKLEDENKNTEPDLYLDIIPKKDKEWICTTTKHLKDMVDNACSRFLLHNDHNVRMSVLECVRNIRFQCHLAFCELMDGTFIDVIVRLLLDPYSKIAEEAKVSLDKFRTKSEQFLSERLRDRLFELSDSLYYEVNATTEASKRIKEISCIFNALGSTSIDSMIMIGGRPLRHLIFAIANSLAVDVDRLPVHISDSSTLNATEELPLLYNVLQSDLYSICNCFVECRNIHVVFEHLLEFISIAQPKESLGLLLLSNILSRCIYQKLYPKFTDEQVDMFQLFIEQAVCHLHSLKIEEAAQDYVIRSEVNANDHSTYLAALQLMLCGEAFSCLVSKHRSRQILLDSLFEILQWTSSANKLCAAAAEKTLLIIAKTMGSEDISSLCVEYGGYLITRIAADSHGFSRESRAPLAICSLMNHCDSSELFGHVQYMVPLMLSAIDYSYQISIIRVLRALLSIVRAMRRWFKDVLPIETENQIEDSDIEDRKINEGNHPFVVVTLEIMKRTKHLLSSPHLPIRVLVLDILEVCTSSLRNFYDEVLPMLHQNWPGVLSRLHDREIHIQMRAFQVIASMCAVSKSFLYRRFKEEAWPIIRNFMIKHSKEKYSTELSYIYSHEFKYQKAVLEQSFTLWEGLEADESDKSLLVDILHLYCGNAAVVEELRKVAAEALERCNSHKWGTN